MQKNRVGAQLMFSHNTEIMQVITFSPVIFYMQFVFCIICLNPCNMLYHEGHSVHQDIQNVLKNVAFLSDLSRYNETQHYFQCSILTIQQILLVVI